MWTFTVMRSVLWLAEESAREAVGALESTKGKASHVMHFLKEVMNFKELGKYMAYLSVYQKFTIKLLLVHIDCILG